MPPVADDLLKRLRLLSGFHMGTDLVSRLADAERYQEQQRQALAEAADEIERLRACCKATPPRRATARKPSVARPAPKDPSRSVGRGISS